MSKKVEKIESNSKVRFRVEVEAQIVEQYYKKVLEGLARRTKVPGFRPGRAPISIVERFYEPQELMERLESEIIPSQTEEVLKEQGIVPMITPSVQIVQMERGAPLIMELTVYPLPNMSFPPKGDLEVTVERKPVSESDIEQAINRLRQQYATLVPEEKQIEENDFVVYDARYESDGQAADELSGENRQAFVSDLRQELREAIVGKRQGDTVEVEIGDVTLPSDATRTFPSVVAKITIREVKVKKLPEFDDDFVRQISNGAYQNVEDLRKAVIEDLKKSFDEEVEQELENRILDELADRAAIEPPNDLVESELERVKQSLKAELDQRGLSMEQYFQTMSKRQEEWEAEQRKQIVEDLRRVIVLECAARVFSLRPDSRSVISEAALRYAMDGGKISKKNPYIPSEYVSLARGVYRRRLARQYLRQLYGKIIDREVSAERESTS